MAQLWRGIGILALAGVALSCASAARNVYYDAWEGLGVEKRDILRDRVEDGQQDQREAQEQFQSAYERFKAAARFDGGNLEKLYDKLNTEYERSAARAEDVTERIASIEQVAADLFREWEGELDLFESANARREGQRQLDETKQRYGTLISAMKRAEAKMDPVLRAFRDQVLLLKHSLNARAIAALDNSVREIEDDVEALIRDIGVSIREAESFLASEKG